MAADSEELRRTQKRIKYMHVDDIRRLKYETDEEILKVKAQLSIDAKALSVLNARKLAIEAKLG